MQREKERGCGGYSRATGTASAIFLMALFALSGCSKLEPGVQTLNPVEFQFHGNGWTDPASSNFHGESIAAASYSMVECESCHGADYKGGTANVSCLSCHTRGPKACNVCHGSSASIAPPKDLQGDTVTTARGVGAHQKHLKAATMSGGYGCATCHLPPTSFSDPVHINSSSPGAPILFTDSLAYTPSGLGRTPHYPNPQYDRSTGTCSDVYCHGSFLGGNANNAVVWTAANQASCGSCHGDPVSGNPQPLSAHPRGDLIQNCQGCHYVQDSTGTRLPVAEHLNDGTYRIDIPSVHANGKLNLVGGEVGIGARISEK